MKPSHGFSFFVFNVHLLWFMLNDQIDAHFFSMHLFQFSTCFEQPRAHHQENQLHQYNIWYMSPTQSDIYQMLYWYNWLSWWWTRGCSKHVDNWNKYIAKNCASIWSFTWIITNALSTKYKIHFNTILIYAYVFQVGSFLRVFRSKPCTLLLALYIVVSLIFNLTTAIIFGKDLCTIFSNVLLNHQSEFEMLSLGRRSKTK